MANQRSTIHEIPLKTQDLCLNVFDADIKPYEGFRKNNSPFYGSTLSPFYYKKSAAVGDKTYVHTDGTTKLCWPQIDWENISNNPLWKAGDYDNAVLAEMGLKWNADKTVIIKDE